mmetsp:Transcript_55756/g.103130  ORF Transcript_55756/g.103130 Transcript_55756/m.103130 type:complete len:396 (-) Transcript_55756:270-1457(-)
MMMDPPFAAPFRVPQHAVQVISNTWARDSHDLFDFEASQLHTVTFTVQRSMKCIRSDTEVQMIHDHLVPPAGADPLLRLLCRDGSFWVDKASPSTSSRKLWLVVRDLGPDGHKLCEGDVMKLGRFKFRVKQLVGQAAEGTQPVLKLGVDEGVVASDTDQGQLKSTMCRICLLEGAGEDDPLIRPCSCKGSIEYIHLGCLRHWIRGRLNFSDTPGGSFFYRPLSCELCKEVYPAYVEADGERQSLVEVPKTTPPFIVLENMVRDSQQHASRGLHVISLADNKVLKLGRGHESEVRIADVSISRCHATIRYQNGSFLLEDNKSKFGTLVAMKKPRLLEVGTNTSIQMGRTVLSLALQPVDVSPSGGTGSGTMLQHMSGSGPQDMTDRQADTHDQPSL